MNDNLKELGFIPEEQDDIGFVPEKTIKTSPIEAIARGGASGATMGFADELTGGIEAGLDVLKGDINVSDFLDTYRKHQKESEAEYELAREEHPWYYGGGQLAGGLTTALAAAPLGIAGKAAQASKAAGLTNVASKIAPEGANLLRQGAGFAVGKMAPAAIGGATEGAIYGGLYGAGDSKGGEGKIIEDTMEGVKSGATFGGALGSLGPVIGKGVEVLKGEDNSGLRQSFSNPLFRALKGEEWNFWGDKAFDEVVAPMGKVEAQPLKETIKDLLGVTRQHFDDYLNEVTQAGNKFPITDDLGEALVESYDKIKTLRPDYIKKSPNLQSIYVSLARGEELTPRQMQDMKMIFRDISKTWKSAQDDTGALRDASRILDDVSFKADKMLSTLEGYEELNDFYSIPRNKLGLESYDYSIEKEKELENILDDIYMESENPSGTHEVTRMKNDLFNGLEKMQKNVTYGNSVDEVLYNGLEKLNSTGKNISNSNSPLEAFKAHIKTTSDKFQEAVRGRGSVQRSGSVKAVGNIAAHGSNVPLRGAQFLGKGIGETIRAGKETLNWVNLPANLTQRAAIKLQNTPGLKSYGDALLKASMDGNTQAKNAVIFTLMQKPETRNLLSEENF